MGGSGDEGEAADCSEPASPGSPAPGARMRHLSFRRIHAMTAWSPDRARKTYSIANWASGYFDVDDDGRVAVHPRGLGGPSVVLPEVVNRPLDSGANMPLLVRFPDILGDRLRALQAAFAQAQADSDRKRVV